MNYIYSVTRSDVILNEELKPICDYQFISNRSDLDNRISENSSLNYKIYLIDNVYSAPQFLIHQTNLDYENCAWLKDTAFVSTNSSVIFSKVIKETKIFANRSLESTSLPMFQFQCFLLQSKTSRHSIAKGNSNN